MKVAILLSGGVDSATALRLLQRSGEEVEAFYIKVWLEEELAFLGDCPWEEDLRYARAVCDQSGIPLHVVPLQTAYRELVVEHALTELRAGRTPSPDILCNKCIKFGQFFNHIGEGWDKVASGHYARLQCLGGDVLLLRGADPVKDQTYFLSHLSQSQLRRTLFPIGHLAKSQVRQLAAALDLPNKGRRDSQGICFLGKISYPDFIAFHLGERPGDIVEIESGKILGRHRGYWFYTIGQRHGLGLSGGPWFVVEKRVEDNTVLVTCHRVDETNQRSHFEVTNLNWIRDVPVNGELQVRIRHTPDLANCRVEASNSTLRVHLQTPDPGVAPGQQAVFYDDAVCLGGGTIS